MCDISVSQLWQCLHTRRRQLAACRSSAAKSQTQRLWRWTQCKGIEEIEMCSWPAATVGTLLSSGMPCGVSHGYLVSLFAICVCASLFGWRAKRGQRHALATRLCSQFRASSGRSREVVVHLVSIETRRASWLYKQHRHCSSHISRFSLFRLSFLLTYFSWRYNLHIHMSILDFFQRKFPLINCCRFLISKKCHAL